jgi:hypothetical protein
MSASTPSRENLHDLLKPIKNKILDVDIDFQSDLTLLYESYMNLLLSKCFDDDNNEGSSGDQDNTSQYTIEESKQDILNLLTNSDFDALKKRNFDLELLIDVLHDLLLCLPSSLIPHRFYELCTKCVSRHSDCKEIFQLLPKSHLKLFNMLVKFLKTYSTRNNDINYHNIADVVFHILKNRVVVLSTNNLSSRPTSISKSTNDAVLFLKICADNYADE